MSEQRLSLKAARVNAGLTQKEAAIALGVGQQTLSNYENGVSYPDVPVIRKIEKLYGVEYKNLLFYDEIRV